MVVINSSPIISLAKIGKLELLRKLFGEVYVTEQVYKEIMSKPTYPESMPIKKASEDKWLKVEKAHEITAPLGKGEASSLGLASKLKQPLIIDDKKAAFIAKTIGVECHGTLYVVLLALKRGLIKNKKEAIDIVNQLINNKLYLSSEALSEFYALLDKINVS
ncbi:DUF3368 domain-containing protein [Candidatus Woesearchaeota archaeon]|nr:DUF3368 domain-containing protein [Candidatus Woesearchaeota archaeon]